MTTLFQRLLILAMVSLSLWAADFAGKWKVTSTTTEGEMQFEMTITEKDGKFSVKLANMDGEFQVKEIEAAGDTLTFSASTPDATYKTKLQFSGGSLEGTFSGTDGISGKVKGSRQQ